MRNALDCINNSSNPINRGILATNYGFQQMKKWFVPQRDITAYELAEIFRRASGSPYYGVIFTSDQWDKLPQEIKRHFSDINPEGY